VPQNDYKIEEILQVRCWITRIAVFIPVRLRSTRLPEKALIRIKGKPVIQHLIERVKTAKTPELVVLCTTNNPEDSVFIDIARKCNVECFRGSEKDILRRYLDAAVQYKVEFIVNADGDDIFCDPYLIDKTVQSYLEKRASYLRWKDLPLGSSPLGIEVEALKKVCQIKDESDTETGWGMYFTETGLFDVRNLEPEDEELRHPEIRMTLDYPEDLKFVREIFERLYRPERVFTLRDILRAIKQEPSLAEINRGVQEKYWERFNKRAKIRLSRKT
jgi:spore coat polysaccharide biosynthesis protein SpsF